MTKHKVEISDDHYQVIRKLTDTAKATNPDITFFDVTGIMLDYALPRVRLKHEVSFTFGDPHTFKASLAVEPPTPPTTVNHNPGPIPSKRHGAHTTSKYFKPSTENFEIKRKHLVEILRTENRKMLAGEIRQAYRQQYGTDPGNIHSSLDHATRLGLATKEVGPPVTFRAIQPTGQNA